MASSNTNTTSAMDPLLQQSLANLASSMESPFANLATTAQSSGLPYGLGKWISDIAGGYQNYFSQMPQQVEGMFNEEYGKPYGGDIGHRLQALAGDVGVLESPFLNAYFEGLGNMEALTSYLLNQQNQQSGPGYESLPEMSAPQLSNPQKGSQGDNQGYDPNASGGGSSSGSGGIDGIDGSGMILNQWGSSPSTDPFYSTIGGFGGGVLYPATGSPTANPYLEQAYSPAPGSNDPYNFFNYAGEMPPNYSPQPYTPGPINTYGGTVTSGGYDTGNTYNMGS